MARTPVVSPTALEHDERPTRGIWVYSAEVVAALGLGLVFLLALLLLLQWLFPGGSGVGVLVRGVDRDGNAGTRLAFDETGGAMIAILTDVKSQVMDKPASSVVWSPAERGRPLGNQHAVQTQTGSSATITFDENTVIELAERSVIVVRKPRRALGSRKRRASVVFMDGFLSGRVGKSDDDTELEILAAGGTLRASGGQDAEAALEVRVEEEGSAIVVSEGTVELDWGGKKTLIQEGFSVTYDEESGPGTPVELPSAPRLRSPRNGARFDFRASRPRIDFAWRASDTTRTFRLEIARDAAFAAPVYDGELSATELTHEHLDAGTYHWRVTPKRGTLAGTPSPVRRLVVVRDDVPPALDLEFPEGPVARSDVEIRGTTEPGCRVFVGDLPAPVDEQGGFELTLPLRDGYNFVVVQSVDPTGNTAFANHTILARIAGRESTP